MNTPFLALIPIAIATIVVAVELDDKSHDKASHKEADDKKGKAFSATGVALICWQTSALPNESAIRLAFVK